VVSSFHIFHPKYYLNLGVLITDGVWIGEWIYWPLVYTTRNYTLQVTDTHRLVFSQSVTVSTSRFLATDLTQWRFFSFLHSGPLVTATRVEHLSTDNSTNRVPGWRPFHISLLDFSSHADFHLTIDNWSLSLNTQLLHVIPLNWTPDNFNQQLTCCPSHRQSRYFTTAVYRQSVRLGAKPLETHDQRNFFNWTIAVIVLM
jgi:hypothetical protein